MEELRDRADIHYDDQELKELDHADLLKRAKSKTSRQIIKDADLSSAFGIDMKDLPAPIPKGKKKPKSGKKVAQKAAKTVAPEVKSKKVPKKKE